ncbi:MAG: hypothetical protein JXR25_06135 [Pontiellaceae bacterium]|nr:hypothetical protein [Pontiellaceae bacterium]MBN2784387.1 hypothetical protein [Pontiellaceae bacterium]
MYQRKKTWVDKAMGWFVVLSILLLAGALTYGFMLTQGGGKSPSGKSSAKSPKNSLLQPNR